MNGLLDRYTKDGRDVRFDDIVYLVEADSFSQLMLWKENSNLREQGNENAVEWEEDSLGFWQTIGEFGGMPVTLSVSFAKIDGRRIAFYSSESLVVHWDMVKNWVQRQAPDVGTTNAMNFHHAIHHIKKLNQ